MLNIHTIFLFTNFIIYPRPTSNLLQDSNILKWTLIARLLAISKTLRLEAQAADQKINYELKIKQKKSRGLFL